MKDGPILLKSILSSQECDGMCSRPSLIRGKFFKETMVPSWPSAKWHEESISLQCIMSWNATDLSLQRF